MSKRISGFILLAIYIGSVVLANWLTSHYGLVAVGLGLSATAGTWAISGAVMTRDLLQDSLGRVVVLAGIVAAALLSYVVASPKLAFASGLTFLLGETAELLVYTPLRRRARFGTPRWAGVVGVANATGILLDTVLFLWLAGFPFAVRNVEGQLLGKAWVTIGVVALIWLVRPLLTPTPAATAESVPA